MASRKKMKSRTALFAFVALAFLMAGCGTTIKQTKVGPSFFPVKEAEVQRGAEGSLWRPEARDNFLFIDNKARGLNDIVNVLIVESSSGSNEASTEGGKNSSVSANVSNFFGLIESFRRSNRNVSADSLLSADFQKSFSGSGTTSRSGTITASVEALVRQVLPNGNLYIEGSKEIMLNNESQYITVSGTIRSEDIRPDNTILSSLIVDARIAYTGFGFVADKQKQGAFSKLLDTVWPF